MSDAASVRVFFEPRIAAHPPELYRFDELESGVDAGAAESELGRYRDDGFLMVRGLLAPAQLEAARAELEQMARSERPDCAMIWYEGALRDHLALDASADRPLDGTTTASGFVQGQEGALPNVDPALRARFVRKFMSFVGQAPALTALARDPRMLALARRLLGGEPELFQDMALVKPAQGREKPWHQDHAYFNVAMGTPIVGVWIPMGRVTPENGCMHLLRGGHKAARGRISSGATGRSATSTSTRPIAWPCRCRPATCCSSTGWSRTARRSTRPTSSAGRSSSTTARPPPSWSTMLRGWPNSAARVVT